MDDLIDRQAAIDAVNTALFPKINTAKDAEKALRTLPSAQPEQKTGRWQYVDYGGFGNWHCTACRKICICNGDFDFCPYCGARMEDGDG